MDKKIHKYLKEEKQVTSETVERMLTKTVTKYDDIKDEFEEWLDKRTYKQWGGVKVQGWSAQKIAEKAPFLDGIGVFNFLVTLRDEPEKGLEIIEKGFVIR